MTLPARFANRSLWTAYLSNAELVDQFCEAVETYFARRGADDVVRRLDVLGNEISRREAAGLLTDDDWRVDGAPAG